MPAGDYRLLVNIERPVRRENSTGEQVITFEPFMQVRAAVSPLNAREAAYAKQAQLTITHNVRIRWFAGLESDMRITWAERDGTERILGIKSIFDKDERHIEWQIQCAEQRHG